MDLKKYIRSIQDYPKKGILFRDITTLIKDKDAFKIMGLELNADWPIIQKKFKTLVKKFHPDKNSGNKQFEDKLKKITLAYSHLKLIMIKK